MVRIGNLMKQDLASLEFSRPASVAAKLMQSRKVGSVLVKQNGTIVGIVTEADIIRKVVAVHRAPEYTPVGCIMSTPVIGIPEEQPIYEAAHLMNQSGTRHLVVTNQEDIVGMISVRDLLHPVATDEF